MPRPPKPRFVPLCTIVSCAFLNNASWSPSLNPRRPFSPVFPPSSFRSFSRFDPTTPPQAKPARLHQSLFFVLADCSPSYSSAVSVALFPPVSPSRSSSSPPDVFFSFFSFSFFFFLSFFSSFFFSSSSRAVSTTTGAAASPFCTPYLANCSASNLAIRSSFPTLPPNVDPR